METFTTEEAQENLAALIQSAANDTQLKLRITSSNGNVVLLSEEAYHNLLITLEMLSTPLFLETNQE